MQEESSQQPIPISQARSKREASPKFETTPDEMRQMLADVLDEKLVTKIATRQAQAIGEELEQRVAAKITRLEVSINRLVDHFEGVRNGTAEDAALRVTTDSSAVDLAIAGVTLFPEDYYIYTSGELAEKLSIRLHDVTKLTQKLALKNDSQYHKAVKTGKTTQVQKYSEAALTRMKAALESGEYVAVYKEW